MRFTKFGKALLMGALSLGVVFGVTSCVQSYSVGYLFVTGTVTASSGNNGIITGYNIDHNTGQLYKINGLPISSGGSNPVRAVLTTASRYVYVLNRGVDATGDGQCTTANPCQNSNITQFAVGANGILTAQQTFYTQGVNPFRLIMDASGNFLMVLDHDAPDSATYAGHAPTTANSCMKALGASVTSCGDITVFQIDQSTGRLSTVVNAQVTAANGSQLTFFPVPANPVDLAMTGSYVLTLVGSPTATVTSFPYTNGTSIWPYAYASSNGQLTLSQNSAQLLTTTSGPVTGGTALVNTPSNFYVLDNQPISTNFNGTATNSQSQILPYSVGTGGLLSAATSGVIPDDPNLANPTYALIEAKNKYIYVANQGNNTTGTNPQSGIAGYTVYTSPSYQLQFIPEEPFGSGSGPQCIVEDPSDQYVFEANQFDSSITGRTLDPNTGDLNPMRGAETYTLPGPPTWCFIDGRTG